MVIAQTVLVTPIVAALARQVLEDAWREYEEQLRSLGARPACARQ
jgi:tungstate transport system permease protein